MRNIKNPNRFQLNIKECFFKNLTLLSLGISVDVTGSWDLPHGRASYICIYIYICFLL